MLLHHAPGPAFLPAPFMGLAAQRSRPAVDGGCGAPAAANGLHPDGMPAISRRWGAAPPPVRPHPPRMPTPEGSQHKGAATPPGSNRCRQIVSGGIAALNHRLIAGIPPGCNRNRCHLIGSGGIATLNHRLIAATPPGSNRCRLIGSGGIAALNHRLIAGIPPGCTTLPGSGKKGDFCKRLSERLGVRPSENGLFAASIQNSSGGCLSGPVRDRSTTTSSKATCAEKVRARGISARARTLSGRPVSVCRARKRNAMNLAEERCRRECVCKTRRRNATNPITIRPCQGCERVCVKRASAMQ
jgi:hypothetical protein